MSPVLKLFSVLFTCVMFAITLPIWLVLLVVLAVFLPLLALVATIVFWVVSTLGYIVVFPLLVVFAVFWGFVMYLFGMSSKLCKNSGGQIEAKTV